MREGREGLVIPTGGAGLSEGSVGGRVWGGESADEGGVERERVGCWERVGGVVRV